MRRLLPPIAMLAGLLVFACGGDGPTNPDPIDATEMAGVWTAELDDGTGQCDPDRDGAVTVFFRLEVDDVDFTAPDGDVIILSDWGRTSAMNEPDMTLSGGLNVDREDFELSMFAQGQFDSGPAIRMTGSIESTSRLEGTFTDEGVEWPDGCTGDVVATR